MRCERVVLPAPHHARARARAKRTLRGRAVSRLTPLVLVRMSKRTQGAVYSTWLHGVHSCIQQSELLCLRPVCARAQRPQQNKCAVRSATSCRGPRRRRHMPTLPNGTTLAHQCAGHKAVFTAGIAPKAGPPACRQPRGASLDRRCRREPPQKTHARPSPYFTTSTAPIDAHHICSLSG